MNLFTTFIYCAISLFVIANYGLILTGIVARIIARVHGRYGIPLWQPYLDIIKNNAKRTAISHGVMFFLGPVFRLAGGVGTYLFIPAVFGSVLFSNLSFSGDLLLVMYFIFFGQLGMALGAGESGHPYSAIGVARGLAQMTAFEVPFALSVIALVIQYQTLSITDIVAAQQGGVLHWTLLTNPLATIAGMIAFLGMTGHSPFDIVISPQEIPIGPPTEFHSSYLGMLQTNRAVFNAAKLVLFMNLYFGGATNIISMMLKTFAIYMVTVFIGVSFPRYRVEQCVRFFLKIPTLIGLMAVVLASTGIWGGPGGVVAIVQNVDTVPLKAVSVNVTGNSYHLGDMAPGEMKRVIVSPNGESHLEIQHGDAQHDRTRLVVGSYFERGYTGSISVEITTDNVIKVQDEIRAGTS